MTATTLELIVQTARNIGEKIKDKVEYHLPEFLLPEINKKMCADAKKIRTGKKYLKLAKEMEEFFYKQDYSQEKTVDLLERFTKKEQDETAVNGYCITRDIGPGYSRKFKDGTVFTPSSQYYDAQYAFVLCDEEKKPLANISFKAENNAIKIMQIQGTKGKQEQLKPIKWERMLLALVWEWARENSIEEVQIISHKDSEWHLVREYGKMLYDVNAQRSGFKYSADKNVYVKKTGK